MERYSYSSKICWSNYNRNSYYKLLTKYSFEIVKKNLKKNFMAPFYGWGSTASRLEPLQGCSLLITTKSPEIPGTHFIDLGRTNG